MCSSDLDEIVDSSIDMIRTYLHEDLTKIGKEKKTQIDRLVQTSKPQYRYLLNKRPEVYEQIPTGLTDDRLDLELYKHQQEWEFDTAKQKKDIDEKA